MLTRGTFKLSSHTHSLMALDFGFRKGPTALEGPHKSKALGLSTLQLMAKRFSDSDKWRKPWFRKLKPAYKLLWLYVLDNCDHAGIWSVDLALAEFQIGATIAEPAALESMGNQIYAFDNGTKWLIKDFITFQYGVLNEGVKAHRSAINILTRYNLLDKGCLTLTEPLPNSFLTVQDKDKDKDTITLKNTNGTFSKPTIEDAIPYFAELGMPESEALTFVDHYSSNGWRVGKNPMKDWKAAARNWKKRWAERVPSSGVIPTFAEATEYADKFGYPMSSVEAWYLHREKHGWVSGMANTPVMNWKADLSSWHQSKGRFTK